MPRSPTYEPTIIAAALAAVAGGESVRQVSQRLGIPKSTVQHWVDGRGVEQKALARSPATQEVLEALVFDTVVATLEAIRARAVTTSDPAWIQGQSADALAALDNAQWHSIAAVIRSFRPADAAPTDGDDGGEHRNGTARAAPHRNGTVDSPG